MVYRTKTLPPGLSPPARPREGKPRKRPRKVKLPRKRATRVVLPFLDQVRLAGLPLPEPEHVFAPPRKWALDWAWPDPSLMLAVEIDGGTFSGGRHVRGRGYEDDCVKLGEAVILGWAVLRVTTDMVRDGRALDFVCRAMAAREGA